MSAASSALSTLHRLHDAREEGDYTLSCRGTTLRAHSYILAASTVYFERALATEVGEGGRLGMEVGDCEPATLAAAVAFMYGVEVPAGFPDLQGLLGLADRLLLEELKEEAGCRIAQHIDAVNFRTVCELADVHKARALAVACARFLLAQEEEVDWPALQQLPLVVLAVAEETRLVRIEVKMEKMRIEANNTRKIFNRYLDTNSDDEEVDELEVDNREYGDFIRASVAVGTRVARR